LLRHSEQEKVIESYELTEDQKKVKERLDWIWEPFETSTNSTLSIIAGRVAYLISRVPLEIANSVRVLSLDPRLIIPICSIELYNQKTNLLQITSLHLCNSIKKAIEIAKEKDANKISIEIYDHEMRNILGEIETLWDFLFLKIEPSLQITLLYKYVSHPRLIQEDWYGSIKRQKQKETIRSLRSLEKQKIEKQKEVTLLESLSSLLSSLLFMVHVLFMLVRLTWSRKSYWKWTIEERTLRGQVSMPFELFGFSREEAEKLAMEMDAEWQKTKDAV